MSVWGALRYDEKTKKNAKIRWENQGKQPNENARKASQQDLLEKRD